MTRNAHASIGMQVMYAVWVGLLTITLVEVVLAYLQFPVLVMLVALLGLSFLKAAMIMSYFMHLKFERMTLIMIIIPGMVMCMLLMNTIFPDSVRVRDRGVFRDAPGAAPAAPEGHR